MIEDSNDIRAVIEDLLGQIGPFEVVGRVATEKEGVAWLEANAPDWDLAIVDLVLREGSGFNLIRRFREANERARILVLSDYATPSSIKVRCVEFGADAVFTKGDIKAFTAYLAAWRPPLRAAGLEAQRRRTIAM